MARVLTTEAQNAIEGGCLNMSGGGWREGSLRSCSAPPNLASSVSHSSCSYLDYAGLCVAMETRCKVARLYVPFWVGAKQRAQMFSNEEN